MAPPPSKKDTVLPLEYLSVWFSCPARTENNAPYLTNIIYLFLPLLGSSLFFNWLPRFCALFLFYLVLKCFPT